LRIGEVAIISHKANEPEDFIKSVCGSIEIKNEVVSFGRLEIDEQLALHLYGISIENQNRSFFWDIVSRKMLGYVLIFDWDDQKMLDAIKPIADHFSQSYEAPIVIVANIKDQTNPPVPEKFYKPEGILLSTNSIFTFGQVDDPECARRILILLVNLLLVKMP
jgi:signal recognition particle receptor subunit beta